MEHPVAARDQNCAGIGRYVGADRSGISLELDASYGARAEIVDEDTGEARGCDVGLRAVGGSEEVHGLAVCAAGAEGALVQFDALYGIEGQGFGTQGSRLGRTDIRGNDVEAGGVENEHVNAVGNEISRRVRAINVEPGKHSHKDGIGWQGQDGRNQQSRVGGNLIGAVRERGDIRGSGARGRFRHVGERAVGGEGDGDGRPGKVELRTMESVPGKACSCE